MGNNMEAPERFWADQESLTWVENYPSERMKNGEIEYIRADLAAPSAPAEVDGLVERLRGIALGNLEEEIGLAFDCTRVWEAWSVGTMGQDDFVPITERIDDLVDAAIEPFTTALTALQAENERLRASRRIMHRRAQKAEGRSDRLLWWLGGIKRLADLSKHWRMAGFTDAAMRGSKPDTGTAWILGHLTCRREADAAIARAEKAEAERDAWKAVAEDLDSLLEGAVSYYPMASRSDVQWVERKKKVRAAHAKLKGEV